VLLGQGQFRGEGLKLELVFKKLEVGAFAFGIFGKCPAAILFYEGN
jgi:hypothetical protein